MKTALVVIDVQSYFLKRAPGDLASRIADHIQKSKYDAVVFTVFQNKAGSNWERTLKWSKCKLGEDLELAVELKEFTSDSNVFIKHAYSAFKGGNFEEYLQSHGVKRLDLCGVDLEGCVLATAYEAFDKGYEVKVLFELSYSRAGLSNAAKSIILRDIQTKNDPRPH